MSEAGNLRFLITGGCGFIGSAFVNHLLKNTKHSIINIDKLTYSAVPKIHDELPRYIFKKIDIQNGAAIREILRAYKPDIILHLAAESHVDNSIASPDPFMQTNIMGTYELLKATLNYWLSLESHKQQTFRFHHVSTDEVYGSLTETGYFTEQTAYAPNSPYAASKSASDLLVRAWHKTYHLPITMSHCSNNYGPYQFPEKLIPRIIFNALKGNKLPIYGTGNNIRDWLHVDDHVKAVLKIIESSPVGESYLIGGNCERTNLQVVNQICQLLDHLAPHETFPSYTHLIEFVEDRAGHDFRYASDTSKLQHTLGWRPSINFNDGLDQTVKWYLDKWHSSSENPLKRAML